MRRRRAAPRGQLNIRGNDDRHRRVRREPGRRRDRLRLNNSLVRKRRSLQHRTGVAVADALLRVEYQRLPSTRRGCECRGRGERQHRDRGVQRWNNDAPQGAKQSEWSHERTGLVTGMPDCAKNALPYRGGNVQASRC
jgi:hypothetical protein